MKINALWLSVFCALLVSCGGGSGGSSGNGGNNGGGNSDFVTIDDGNSDDIVGAALDVSEQIITNENLGLLPIAVSVDETSYLDSLFELVTEVANQQNRLGALVPLGVIVTEVEEGSCGGSATFTYDDDIVLGEPWEWEWDFNNYCLGDSELYTIVYDGFIDVEYVYQGDSLASYSWEYDLTITATYNDEVEVYSEAGSFSCTYNSQTQLENCTSEIFESEYTSQDGQDTYTVDAELDGDEINGYNFTATVESEDYGVFEVAGTGLVPSDIYDGFDAGTIEIIDSSGNVVVTVVCYVGEYTVTFNGVTETYFL